MLPIQLPRDLDGSNFTGKEIVLASMNSMSINIDGGRNKNSRGRYGISMEGCSPYREVVRMTECSSTTAMRKKVLHNSRPLGMDQNAIGGSRGQKAVGGSMGHNVVGGSMGQSATGCSKDQGCCRELS